jgi:hypothetical protein
VQLALARREQKAGRKQAAIRRHESRDKAAEREDARRARAADRAAGTAEAAVGQGGAGGSGQAAADARRDVKEVSFGSDVKEVSALCVSVPARGVAVVAWYPTGS